MLASSRVNLTYQTVKKLRATAKRNGTSVQAQILKTYVDFINSFGRQIKSLYIQVPIKCYKLLEEQASAKDMEFKEYLGLRLHDFVKANGKRGGK